MGVDELLTKMSPFVHILARASSRDPGTQDDLYQEAMFHLLEVPSKYGHLPEVEFILVAKAVVRNAMTDAARTRRSRRDRESVVARPDLQPGPGPAHEAAVNEMFRLVEQRLVGDEVQVFGLMKRGLSEADISKVMGIGKTATWRRTSRIWQVIEEVRRDT